MIEGVFPVLIGDREGDEVYSNYFVSNCYPNPPNIAVASLEAKLHEHLVREGLGSPYKEVVTVSAAYTSIVANQGGLYCGRKNDFFSSVVSSICDMVRICKQS